MNIYQREFRVNQKSLLLWSISLSALGILVMAFFPTIAREAETFEKIIAAMPGGLVSAFGLETISMTDLLGYYATKQYTTVTLFGSIFAIMLGSGALSREESEKTIEFLLSKPIKRTEIVTRKLLSIVTIIGIFNLLISVIMLIMMEFVKQEDYRLEIFLLLSLGALLLHLTFASIGLCLSVLLKRSKNILPISLGIVLFSYFLGIASTLSDKIDFLRYFSPFKYLDPIDIIGDAAFKAEPFILMIIINLLAIVLTYGIYNKKDFAA